MSKKNFITIAGNIGVGKSTLTKHIASSFNWTPVYEPHNDNPFLSDFYGDMKRWGFHSQVFFLSKRLQQHHQLLQIQSSVIQDRSVYEDAEIFAHNLFLQGYISKREWNTYKELYETLVIMLKQPDLIVFLQASVSTLQQRIKQRGREFEKSISSDYLAQLNQLYEEWISNFTLCPVLTIETDKLDYANNQADLENVLEKIRNRIESVDTN
jgi:deoxyadenosine/deoxycytidine kinase